MLSRPHRLTRSADFSAVVRARRRDGGFRSAGHLMVLHALRRDDRVGAPPRVGFVVSKAVGGAVVRNRTKRVLRALVHVRLGGIPDGMDLVVRANPASASAAAAELGTDLDRLLADARRTSAAR